MNMLDDTQIIRSWEKKAKTWIEAIQNEEIESRKLVTNQTIIDAIVDYKPATALVHQLFNTTQAQGHGREGTQVLAGVLRQLSGVEDFSAETVLA